MGPWFVRIESQPFRPGCNYATLLHLIERGTVRADTAVRGPTTRQFWMLARWCPGVAHRLGLCHSCQAKVDPESSECSACGAAFARSEDRQALGLGDVRPLPGRSVPSEVRRAGVAAAPAAALAPDAGSPSDTDATGRVSSPSQEAAADDLGDEGLRELRLRRDLRRSKRWTAVWSALALITLAGLGGYAVFLQLDLGSGPVGQWLSARQTSTDSDRADVAPGPNDEVHRPQAAVGEADLLPPGPDDDAPPPGLASTDEGEAGGPAVESGTGEEPGEDGVAGARIRTLSRLRGLR